MVRPLLACAIIVCGLLAAATATANKSGDMFDDNGFAVQNRPEVPSDQQYGWHTHPDMFRPQQPYMRSGKDMFDFMPVPPNPGIEQHFSAHLNQPAPATPLFHNPNENPQ